MINNRQLKILKYLRTQREPVQTSWLARQFSVSVRSIQNDLSSIDDFLIEQRLSPLKRERYSGVTLQLASEEWGTLERMISNADARAILWQPEERADVLLKYLFGQQDYVTLATLAEALDVSKGTVLSDLDKLRQSMRGRAFSIQSSSRQGICLAGDEEALREYVLSRYLRAANTSCIYDEASYDRESIGNHLYRTHSPEESHIFYDGLCRVEEYLHLKFSAHSKLELLASLEIAADRTRLGRSTSIDRLKLESIVGTTQFKAVYQLAQSLEKELDIHLSLEEIGQLTVKVIGGSVVRSNFREGTENIAEIQVIVCNLIHNVGRDLGMDFSKDLSLYSDLIYHIRPAIYRMRHGIPQENPLLDQIKADYSYIFQAVKENVSSVEALTSAVMSEDEIGFISVHFASGIEKQRCDENPRPQVLIVCDSGIGTSNLLSARLTSLYEVTILQTVAYHELKQALTDQRMDYILTTIDIPFEEFPIIARNNIKSLRVTPLLTPTDISLLDRHFHHRYRQTVNFQDLIELLEHSCTIYDPNQLYADLSTKFFLTSHPNPKKGDKPMLKDVMTRDMIELDFSVKNWEEAVRETGRLLMGAGCIDTSYVEGMVDVVKRMGAYIVIGEGIALPHSRSAEGAFKIGICMLRLATPVPFGHPENDPVDLVFGLSSTDNESHLLALADLSETLSDDKKVARLRTLSTVEEVYQLLTEEG